MPLCGDCSFRFDLTKEQREELYWNHRTKIVCPECGSYNILMVKLGLHG